MKNRLSASTFLRGMTMIELLIVIAVMGVLAAVVITALNPAAQLNKANDAKRKSDLSEIQNALELYYQDNQQYPASVSFGSAWAPYMARLPQDPKTGKNYVYLTDASRQSYWLYASLDNWQSDAQACVPNTNTQCNFQTSGSCGGGTCNYGKSSSNVTPH
jgi:general secretion pathway protein G